MSPPHPAHVLPARRCELTESPQLGARDPPARRGLSASPRRLSERPPRARADSLSLALWQSQRQNRRSVSRGSRNMSLKQIAKAMERVASVMRRRPHAGVMEDPAATARWVRQRVQ